MDAFLSVFGSVPLSVVVLVIAALVFLFVIGKKVYKAITDWHDNRQKREEVLNTICTSIEEIKTEQKVLSEAIVEMRDAQAEFAAKQTEFEDGIKKRKMNEIRDNLIKQYQKYTDMAKNPLQAWSAIEKDSFFALFHDYEELGGNGYIHTTVEPAMNALKVVPMDDLQELEKLAASRIKPVI